MKNDRSPVASRRRSRSRRSVPSALCDFIDASERHLIYPDVVPSITSRVIDARSELVLAPVVGSSRSRPAREGNGSELSPFTVAEASGFISFPVDSSVDKRRRIGGLVVADSIVGSILVDSYLKQLETSLCGE